MPVHQQHKSFARIRFSVLLFQSSIVKVKPGFHIVFVGRTVLGKTVKDRERPNGNITERLAKTVSDPQRPSATHKDPQRLGR